MKLPGHRYIPGETARHPEGAFDEMRAAAPERGAEGLAWAHGLRLLEEGFYWEAHEVLEAVWLALPPNAADRVMTQAVIQIANAGLKLLMKRPKAALRLCDEAERLAAEAGRRAASPMGLPPEAPTRAIATLRAAAAAGEAVERGLRLPRRRVG